jgi:RNA polymerase sigma-70 factor (ECF subfamily)
MELTLMLKNLATGYDSEADLLSACRRKDVGAFEELYRQHGTRLKSIACHVVGNRPDAEDAVQEAFLKAYRSIGAFRGDSSVGTWLCRIVVNTCHDLQRKRRKEAPLLSEPERGVASSSIRVMLEDALKRINPKHRMVFLLFEAEGLKHSEIAVILDIPEGTSKAWLFEAKRDLKTILEVRR